MVGGSSERDRQIQLHNSWQQQFEPHAVFLGEPPRHQILVTVEIIQFCLHAYDVGPTIPESKKHFLQLIGIRAILRVINDDIVATRADQPVIACLRLCFRQAVRHDKHRIIGRQLHSGQKLLRLDIVFFNQQPDIQLDFG